MNINDYFLNSGESYLTLLTPGLARSEEAYFGKEAPLAKDLIKYSTELKEFIGTDNNKFKDKKFQNQLRLMLDRFGKAIATDINAETCQIVIIFDRYDVNASAYGINCKSDFLEGPKDNLNLDLDKIADLEDIVITSEGYKFRNPKGKLLAITINHVTFQKLDPESIAAVLAHEIGHNFQNGIFGTYKVVADIIMGIKIEDIQNRMRLSKDSKAPKVVKWLFNHSFTAKFFHYILSYITCPHILTEGVFSKIGANLFKTFFGKAMNENTFLMKEQIRKMDNNEDTDMNEKGTKTISDIVIKSSGTKGSRKEFLDDIKLMEKDQYKDISEKKEDLNEDISIEPSRNFIVNFFRSISKDVQLIQDNVLHFMLLSDYTTNTYEKVTFRKKYEYFADIFATSYGFSPNLYKFLKETNITDLNEYSKVYEGGINKIPFMRALYKVNLYKNIRRCEIHDVHGSAQQRLSNMYTDLMHELNTNEDLTSSQKTAIKNQITELKKADDLYYNEQKEKGFCFKFYNKLIDDRLKGVNQDTEKYILGPIEEVCKEEI